MFGSKHYVPVLKWKRGEQVGLQNMADSKKAQITPLIEVMQGKIADEIVSSINQYWEGRPFFLDFSLILDDIHDDGQPEYCVLLNSLNQLQSPSIPVIKLGFDEEILDNVVRNSDLSKGICLRIYPNDLNDEDIFREMITAIIDRMRVDVTSVDYVLDLEYISQAVLMPYIMSVVNPSLRWNWRNFILSASSFPQDMTQIRSDSIERLFRLEWQLWEMLLTRYNSKRIQRMPNYSDYSIAHPYIIEVDPRIMNPSGNIRYTIDDEYLIVKGSAVKDVRRDNRIVHTGRGYGQMVDLCQALIQMHEFSGPGFSWGDQYIQDCANGQASPGNPETWRRVGTNHHLTFVVNQLSNHPGL